MLVEFYQFSQYIGCLCPVSLTFDTFSTSQPEVFFNVYVIIAILWLKSWISFPSIEYKSQLLKWVTKSFTISYLHRWPVASFSWHTNNALNFKAISVAFQILAVWFFWSGISFPLLFCRLTPTHHFRFQHRVTFSGKAFMVLCWKPLIYAPTTLCTVPRCFSWSFFLHKIVIICITPYCKTLAASTNISS